MIQVINFGSGAPTNGSQFGWQIDSLGAGLIVGSIAITTGSVQTWSLSELGSVFISTSPLPISGTSLLVSGAGIFSIAGSVRQFEDLKIIGSVYSTGSINVANYTGSVRQVNEPWIITGSITPYGVGSIYGIGIGSVYAVVNHGKTIKSSIISVSTSGANQIVASVSGKTIKVIAFSIQAGSNVTCLWQDGATAKTGSFTFNSREGLTMGVPAPSWLFATGSTGSLILNINGNVGVGGHVTFFDDDAS